MEDFVAATNRAAAMNRRIRIPLIAAVLAVAVLLILRRRDGTGNVEASEPSEATSMSESKQSPTDDVRATGGGPGTGTNASGPMAPPRPPDPNLHFRDLTPEQRVRIARLPNGVGG